MDGYLGSACESDEDLRLLWEEKKNLSIFKSMFSYFIHAAANSTAIRGGFMPLHKLQQMDVKQKTNRKVMVRF